MSTPPRFLSRRTLLKASAASLAGLAVAPTLLLSKRARAATSAFGAVRHVLVLHAQGGFRSHATFNAVGSFQHNPFGSQAAADGTQWALGAACGNVGYSCALGSVPSFASITNEVAVLACVDHIPGGAAVVDHVEGHRRMSTGIARGSNGLLSVVGAHHPLYADGFRGDILPPVEIRATDMGLGSGDYAQRRPLTLLGAQAAANNVPPVASGWHSEAHRQLDERFFARRSRAYAKRLKNFRTSKQNAGLFAAALQDPLLDVQNAPGATDAGVDNATLLAVLGDHDLSSIGDPQGGQSWGADVALALRTFARGSPIAVVTRSIYDMHDVERDAYGARTQDLVRQLAGLNFLLKRMAHPDGGTYFDKTLVVTASEFSRNNTFEDSGFNSGNGSDHVPVGDGPARNQALAVMGGVVRGGVMLGRTDDAIDALEGTVASSAVLATILDVLGINPDGLMSAAPIAELFS